MFISLGPKAVVENNEIQINQFSNQESCTQQVLLLHWE
ncbi:hypothetical protein LINPERHAP1_LOCUS31613 [Linum perenne]